MYAPVYLDGRIRVKNTTLSNTNHSFLFLIGWTLGQNKNMAQHYHMNSRCWICSSLCMRAKKSCLAVGCMRQNSWKEKVAICDFFFNSLQDCACKPEQRGVVLALLSPPPIHPSIPTFFYYPLSDNDEILCIVSSIASMCENKWVFF